MKQALLLLFLLTGFAALAQDESPYKYWTIKGNKTVAFEAVYEYPDKDAEQLKSDLLSFIPTIDGMTNVRENSGGIVADMEGYECDFRAMGYTLMGAPAILRYPKFGNVSVQIKDGKYKVVVSNFITDKRERSDPDYNPLISNYKIESITLKMNKSGWATAKHKVTANEHMEEDLYRSFTLPATQPDNDW